MDLQGAFLARLHANPTLFGLVSKIAWGGLPQKTVLPYLRLTKAGAGRSWTHDGPDPLVNPRVQIDIFAKEEREIGPIAEALQAEMERMDRVHAGDWVFSPPGVIVNDIWSGPEEMNGGGSTYLGMHEYEFWAAPE